MPTESNSTFKDQPVTHRISHELHQYVDLGVIEYYLPSIPEGAQYVIGVRGQILKMNPDEAVCFLAGASAVATRMAKKSGLI